MLEIRQAPSVEEPRAFKSTAGTSKDNPSAGVLFGGAASVAAAVAGQLVLIRAKFSLWVSVHLHRRMLAFKRGVANVLFRLHPNPCRVAALSACVNAPFVKEWNELSSLCVTQGVSPFVRPST